MAIDAPSGLTITRTTAWTTRYAAPELIKGDAPTHTLASDVWAWACLLLVVSRQFRINRTRHLTSSQILTDILPYSSKTLTWAVSHAISQNEAAVDISTLEVPQLAKDLLETCWQGVPESRPSMDKCVHTLELGLVTVNLLQTGSLQSTEKGPSLAAVVQSFS